MGELDLINVSRIPALGGSFYAFYESLRLWGGSGSNHAVSPGGSAKERPSRAWGEGEGGGGAGIIMSSNDVGSYEFKQSPWMQMEECSANLARSTSDGSADKAGGQ